MDDQAFAAAQSLQQAGQLDQAIAAYRQLMQRYPQAGLVMANLAGCLRRVGQLDAALELYERALRQLPDAAPIWFNAANAFGAAKRISQAEQAYRRAAEIDPRMSAAWFNLGRLLQGDARHDEADSAYAQALAIEPGNVTAVMNRGNVLRALGRIPEAIAAHRQVTAMDPSRAEAWLNLGNALRDDKQLEAAIEAYQRALSLRDDLHAARLGLIGLLQQQADASEAATQALDAAIARFPDEPEYLFERARLLIAANHKREALPLLQRAALSASADERVWNALGVAHEAAGDQELALQAFAKAIAQQPKFAVAHANYGQLARQMGRIKEGIDALRHAVVLAPNDAAACGNLIDALVGTGHLQEAITQAERALASNLIESSVIHTALGHAYNTSGRSAESLQQLERALALTPSAVNVSNVLFASLYDDAQTIDAKAAQHRDYAARILPAPAVDAFSVPGPLSQRRLRVGYVSADFNEHPVGFFMQPIFAHHDRGAFEVFAYATRVADDPVRRNLRDCVEHWRDAVGYGADQLLELIRRDELDVLVDLAGHTAHNQLPVFAARAAEFQCSYLGYPFSTGLAAMDGYIADAVSVLDTDVDLYNERILRLPHFAFCMQPHPTAPDVSPLPASRNGYLTFGCFNNLAKLSNTTIEVWAGILRALPDARLLLRALGLNDAVSCERVWRLFAALGIDRGRIELLAPVRPIEAFLRGYERVDIALDPMPFNGGTTSFEALWQGVPVLTLPGRGFFARMGAGINHTAGLAQFTASDRDDLATRAQYWTEHFGELARLRASMRATLQATPLFDGRRFTPGFEAVLHVATRARVGA
jgi:protein O-GlcNAc transferase